MKKEMAGIFIAMRLTRKTVMSLYTKSVACEDEETFDYTEQQLL